MPNLLKKMHYILTKQRIPALTNEFHSSTSTMIEKFNMQKSEEKKKLIGYC